MKQLRNGLLRLVVRAAAQAANERRAIGRCAVAHWHDRFNRNNPSILKFTYWSRCVTTRSFSSDGLGVRRLIQASWAGCPQPEQTLRKKEFNGVSWHDEYSWMDPLGALDSESASDSPASPLQLRRQDQRQQEQHRQRLLRHLQREDEHTQQALAAGGVQALKQRLLEEWHELYLAEAGNGEAQGGSGMQPPPERIGPYFYSVVSGPDGGIEAYLRTRAPDHKQEQGQPRRRDERRGPHLGSRSDGAVAAGDAEAVADGGVRARGGRRGRVAAAAAEAGAASPPMPPQVLLDRATVAADARLAASLTGMQLGDAVGAIKLCPRHRLLAYTLPVRHRHDVYCALVRDTATGRLLVPGGVVAPVAGPGGLELAADGRSLLVSRPDDMGRPWQAWLYDLQCAAPPKLLLTETDPRFFLALGRTKDWAYLLLSSNSKTCSEVHILSAADPRVAPPRLVQARTPGLEYFVEHFAPAPSDPALTQTAAVGTAAAATSARQGNLASANEAPAAAAAAAAAGGRLIILSNHDPEAHRRRDGSGDTNGGEDNGSSGGEGSGRGSGGGGRFGRELHVFSAPVVSPGVEHWRPLLGARPGVVVTDMDMFTDCCVLYERREGVPAVSVLPLKQSPSAARPAAGGAEAEAVSELVPAQVPLPPWALHLTPGINADPHSPTLRLTASSPLHPPATFDYHLASGALQLLHQAEAPPAARQLLRRCSLVRLQVPTTVSQSGSAAPTPLYDSSSNSGGGDDGGVVHVPVTLVLPPGVTWPPVSGSGGATAATADPVLPATAMNARGSGEARSCGLTWRVISTASGEGEEAHRQEEQQQEEEFLAPTPRPVLLSVYGAYGLPLECEYDGTVLSLLARGWAVARVHVRGGGEKGRAWHAAGCRAAKRAGVQDCAAAAEALVGAGLTAPGLLAGHAISAGGVTLAAALNARPDLWGAAVLRCAFLELRSSCTDPRLPLTAHEWDEWGDPTDPRDRAAIWDLCPYSNLDADAGGGARGGAGGWRAAVLASCADEDPRVHPSIPAKWVARLRRQLLSTSLQPNNPTLAAHADMANQSGDGSSGNSDSSSGSSSGSSPGVGGSLWRRFASRLLPVGATPSGDSASGDRDDVQREGHGGSVGAMGVCAPLLRVYWDGTGHVRSGEAQAEEAAEEMAFLLRVLPPPPPPLPRVVSQPTVKAMALELPPAA